MCGRFTLRTPAARLMDIFRTGPFPELTPRYNIAPTQLIICLRAATPESDLAAQGLREVVSMRWGLIPFWASDTSIGSRMINARSETAADKPAFRQAWQKRRCLIPADGFYEWQTMARGSKQPWLIQQADEQPFAMAGLWECWHPRHPDGATATEQIVLSCTILTTEANADLRPLHDRMPVILQPADYDMWLSEQASPAQRAQLMRPLPNGQLLRFPVSTMVNRPVVDNAECVQPIELPRS